MTFYVASSSPSRYLVQRPSLCSHPRDRIHKCRSFACLQRSQSHTGSQAQSSSGLTSLSVQHERVWYQSVGAEFRDGEGWHARVVKRQLRARRKPLRQYRLSGNYAGRPDFSRACRILLLLIYSWNTIVDTRVLSLLIPQMQ